MKVIMGKERRKVSASESSRYNDRNNIGESRPIVMILNTAKI